MNDKSVFITGAAAGIGRATALAFAAKGYTVGAYDIDEAGLRTLTDTAGPRVVSGHLDVTDAGEIVERVGEFVSAAGGRLDVMVNNAGVMASGAFVEIPISTYHKLVDVNCKGVVNGLHAAYPHLKRTPGSVVVNLASASAIYGQAELAVYSATKFFVRAMTEALDIEWGRDGIRVIDMWPLYVATAMTADLRTGSSESLGINLTAADVADAIVAAVDAPALRRRIHQVHFPVGIQTKVMATASRFLPAWLSRAMSKRFAQF
jgi:NADP-dependent 3-hydroxy acid dehydrogenase YdfG